MLARTRMVVVRTCMEMNQDTDQKGTHVPRVGIHTAMQHVGIHTAMQHVGIHTAMQAPHTVFCSDTQGQTRLGGIGPRPKR